MRIRRLSIENFRRFHDKFEVSFLGADGKPRPLTVLVGPNMSGKTTILDSLHIVHAALESFADPHFRPELDPSAISNRPDPNQPIHIGVEFSLDHGEWALLDETEKKMGTPGLNTASVDVYRIEFAWPPPSTSYDGIVSATPQNANLAFRGRAVAKVAKKNRVAGEAIFDGIGTVLYLDQHRSVDLLSPFKKTGAEEMLREAAANRDVLPWLELISRLDVKWDTATQGESAWHHVKRLFADLAAPASIDDIKPFDEGFDLRMKKDGQYYYSAGMSSGERQILRLVCNLVAGHAQRSVVLIDELELHLHPRWQRELLAFCRHGGGDSNQFIVSTHSEAILRYVDPADVITLGELGSA